MVVLGELNIIEVVRGVKSLRTTAVDNYLFKILKA